MHLYLPGNQHAANNLVRAIVKDSNDNYTSATDENFLDSGLQIVIYTVLARRLARTLGYTPQQLPSQKQACSYKFLELQSANPQGRTVLQMGSWDQIFLEILRD